jgi:predicted enzyme related to lactoylglutathione lyase
MPVKARYAHTNIVARDWKRVAKFYEEVFGCVFVPPERDLHGPMVDTLTAVPGARIRGGHFRLPGHGDQGPTLEIFEYNQVVAGETPAINRPGLAHLAFEVDDVAAARRAALEAGGRDYGGLVSYPVPKAGTITVVYMADPEGNIVELQHWAP